MAVEDEVEDARSHRHSYACSLAPPARRLMNVGNECPIPSLGRSLSGKLRNYCEGVDVKVKKGG